jgi:hypothetical protein
VILTRVRSASALRSSALALKKRLGFKRAAVAAGAQARGEYAEFDGWLSRFRRAGRATARQLLALWHRLLNNFKLSKIGGGKVDGSLSSIVAAEPGDIARANLHRPHRWFALDFDNFCRAWVFHGFITSFLILVWAIGRSSLRWPRQAGDVLLVSHCGVHNPI